MANFTDINKIDVTILRSLLNAGSKIKSDSKKGILPKHLSGKQVALVFEKPSTRTRASFEVAINHLGGNAIVLTSGDSQLGRGETIADTARVLSRYMDIIMIRTFKHETMTEMAEHASIPVINGLTDYSHPCQVMADIMTVEEHLGSIEDKTIAWVGDCNNVANSWIHAAEKLGFRLNIACPEELSPPAKKLSDNVKIFSDPKEAVKDVDCINTDTWVSMGDKDADYKRGLLAPYQVNDDLMSLAKNNAIFMHCMPAHREDEVTSSVIDGPRSVVLDEAENRLHIQKAILLWCMGIEG